MAQIRCRRTQQDDRVIKALASKDKDYIETNGIVMYKGIVYVPKDKALREQIISAHHDTILAGHPGWHKMVKLVSRDYWWPTMSRQISRYCTGCKGCQGSKPQVGGSPAPLNPHKIPNVPWTNISVDFVGPLPMSLGYDMIMVVIDMFTKECVIIPTTQSIMSEGTAQLFFKNVVPWKGLFRKVVSD